MVSAHCTSATCLSAHHASATMQVQPCSALDVVLHSQSSLRWKASDDRTKGWLEAVLTRFKFWISSIKQMPMLMIKTTLDRCFSCFYFQLGFTWSYIFDAPGPQSCNNMLFIILAMVSKKSFPFPVLRKWISLGGRLYPPCQHPAKTYQ